MRIRPLLIIAAALFLPVLIPEVARAQPCDQCPSCKAAPAPGLPENCTDRTACLARCTVSSVAANLDEARQKAIERLQRDESAAIEAIGAEVTVQTAALNQRGTVTRGAMEQALQTAADGVRAGIDAEVAAAKASREKAARTIIRQVAETRMCFKSALPAKVAAAYGSAATWFETSAGRIGAEGRNNAVQALSSGLSSSRAEAANAVSQITSRLSTLSAPADDVRSKAADIRSDLGGLTDPNTLLGYARDGFQGLRDAGAAGVAAVRDAGDLADAELRRLGNGAAARAQSAARQWTERARAAIAAAAEDTLLRDVPTLAGLRKQIRDAGVSSARLMGCICSTMDVIPPRESKQFDWRLDAVCVRPSREAPYEVALKDYLSRRSSGKRFDASVYARAAKHVRTMPVANLKRAAKRPSTSPGTIRSALSVSGSWEFVGPKNLDVPYQQYYGAGKVSGRVNAVAYDPANPSVLYAGSAGGGLWRSKDRGATWQPLSDARRLPDGTMTQGWPDLQVSAIAVSPSDSNTVYAGLGDFPGNRTFRGTGGGIMKTTDGGLTWQILGTSQFGSPPTTLSSTSSLFAVSDILIDPQNSEIVIATTGRPNNAQGQVWRSTTGGSSWDRATLTTTGGLAPRAQWSGAAMGALDPTTNSRSYYVAGTRSVPASPPAPAPPSPVAIILRSDDQGATWTAMTPPTTGSETVFSVAASPTDPNTVYGLLPGSNTIWRSGDRGVTWTNISANFPAPAENWKQLGYNYTIECGRREGKDFLYVGLIDLLASPDGGSTWTSLGGPSYSSESLIHNDQHAVAVHPTDPNQFLVGNDGGVYAGTLDSSHATTLDDFPALFARFQSLNANLGITEFYTLAVHPADPKIMLGGTQDNATPVSVGDLSSWRNKGGGDGGGVAISPVRPNIQYATSQGWSGTPASGLPPAAFITLDVYRTDGGWEIQSGPLAGAATPQQKIPPFVSTDRLPFTPVIALDPTNSTVLYTGTEFLWRLDDTFPLSPWKWSRASTALSTSGVITAVAVAPSDRGTIYTASADGEIWASFDRGTNWKRLDIPTSGICTGGVAGCVGGLALSVNPADANDVIVGFGVGVNGTGTIFRCTATNTPSPVWTPLQGSGSGALPVIPVNAIVLDPSRAATIFAGTDQGVFVSEDGGANWANAGTPFGLPNVPVTALAVSGQSFLTAATFGRGIWQIDLNTMGLP
jgi:hypothetical protein